MNVRCSRGSLAAIPLVYSVVVLVINAVILFWTPVVPILNALRSFFWTTLLGLLPSAFRLLFIPVHRPLDT